MASVREDATWYVETLLPLLYPAGRPPRPTMCKDVDVLRRLLQRESRADVALVVREIRTQAEYGKLRPWIAPGDDFTMRALLARTNGVITFQRFLHEARKRRERGKPDWRPPEPLRAVFRALGAR